MGVNDLMKKIRDGENHCNTTLKRLIKDTPERIIVGIDMSITIIKMIKRNPNHIDQLFTEPKRPVHGLIDAICNALDPIYKNEGVLVCVFDGLPGSLKKNHAHLSRYGKNEEKRRELEELYKEDDFDSFDEELANAVKVAKLRKELVSFNRPDLLYDLKIELEKRFEGRIYCVGAPFEADHQLAALFHQKIIDLVWTNDNDLCCLGCDVILNLKSDGKCLHVKFDDLLKTRFPDKICKDNIKWSKELLSHVCCFSGCDFIERNPGNSMAKVPDFLKSITDTEGNLMDDVALYNAVKSRWLIPTNVSDDAKAKWTEEYKENHLKLWKHARNMFLFGPASIVTPYNSEISIREAHLSNQSCQTFLAVKACQKPRL
ncbi:hypothetical protein CTEN210_14296 [Chaetoceros tenuissimus]|uniref:Exonuclease 1 n=1 Tax=Chaetoceros tenuissimus TaxID=426638 RepID=A0AAD3D793_9STRA|nr:hypothetical protein CTEN210_14296 [Chaetoceros tenuissimus]